MAGITRRDVMLLVAMTLAIVSMSFVFPALGLGGDNVQDDEIPEFNVSESEVNFSGSFPAAPGSPSTAELVWDDSREEQLNRDWIRGDTSPSGIEIFLDPDPTFTNGSANASVVLNQWDSGDVTHTVEFAFNETGDERIYANRSMGIELQMVALNITPERDEVRYEVVSRTTDSGGWLQSVPLIGGAVDAGAAAAATLGWFVEIVIWVNVFVLDLILSAVLLGAKAGVYFVSLLTWLSTTYTGIISASGGWAAVFLSIPGIIFSAVLGKIVIIAAGLLPTT